MAVLLLLQGDGVEGMNDVAAYTSVLSLCSGGGGLDLGVHGAVRNARTVCYVENEVTASAVLVKNMEAGGLDDAPIWTDLRTFDGAAWRGLVDILIGGYPCQPFSNAGKRLGAEDPRHLWPAVADIVAAIEPEWCFFENVGAHLRLGFREVSGDLHRMGYRVTAGLFTAEEVGAPHRRERLFILSHRTSAECERGGRAWAGRPGFAVGSGPVADSSDVSGAVPPSGGPDGARGATASGASGSVGNADIARPQGRCEPERGGGYELPAWPPGPADAEGWRRVIAVRPDLAPALEPEVRDVADGLARWLGRGDQLHILGNGVVPQQAAYAFSVLMHETEGVG